MAFWLKDRQGNFIDDSLADDAESMVLASELIIVMGLGEKSLNDRPGGRFAGRSLRIPLEELLGYMMLLVIDYLNRPLTWSIPPPWAFSTAISSRTTYW